MGNRFFNFILIIIIGCIAINCANTGRPEGGAKDIEPPRIVSTSPENYSTNFAAKEIRIYFDEFIKIKNLQKQLIISPPMKTQPEITPLGSASKFIKIKIYDTLQPNTTYAFNFGNSIEDNNEGNPYTYYRYVFSTGDHLDSLTVTGNITDALKRQPETFVSVMLYEVDSTFTDSIIYKETPKYITNTLDSLTTFTIENVKEGKYLLVALKDKNGDNKFQQKSDQIAFYDEFIDVPTDSSYSLRLFNEIVNFKPSRPQLVTGQKIMIGYEGDYTGIKVNMLSEVPEDFKYRITKDEKTDTLYYWYEPKLEVDSLVLSIEHPQTTKEYTVRIRDMEKDSLLVKMEPQGSIRYTEDLLISGNIPLTNIDKTKIDLIDKDTLAVEFSIKPLDSLANTYAITFDKTESNEYYFGFYPDALTDFYGKTNDTIKHSFRTQKKDSYGNFRLNIQNAVYPIIVQLTTQQGEVRYEKYATERHPIDFLNISPGDYYIRVIFDTNGNKKYDTGNYLEKIQPEIVKHSETKLDPAVRAGWDTETNFTLN
ncbi:Ig-like domain-containing protein [Hyunsoonleella sp. SJ7]|uniref:Ig-like domain-containing protein n=1 Tax=Hyunsoonleella aquatilis TaxID=2762758 RepID=A0A923H842_9FLAO|nr:Ig-like domain-containing protein [Hyunsoonleella aquatilis]MBC3756949.1 Ig-like domain-containing protein [Hyunsoonleella aquatilis]